MNRITYFILLITMVCSQIMGMGKNPDLDLFGGQDLDAALESFLKELQNLSPEDQQLLEDLGKQMEDEMREKGLDPMNPDDIFKWAEQDAQYEPPVETREPIEIPKPKVEEKAPLISSPENALMILQEIVRYIAEARQKAIFYPDLTDKIDRWQQDINELNYFLFVLQQEDILKHLISKPHEQLFKDLESLYNALYNNVPSIQVASLDEDTPYSILDVKPYSSKQDIDLAYENLLDLYNEKKIRENLKNLPENELQKKIKEAKLSLSFVEDAYSKLNDPNEKKQIDKLLRQKTASEKQSFNQASSAFNNIISAISRAIFDNKITVKIKELLEKHKPEELEKAKAQDALAKQILDKSKQPVRIVPSPKTPAPKDNYEEFYRKINQDKNKNIPYPKRDTSGLDNKKPKESQNGGDKSAGEDKGKDKEASKKGGKGDSKDKKNDKDVKKGDKKDSKSGSKGGSDKKDEKPKKKEDEKDPKKEAAEKHKEALNSLNFDKTPVTRSLKELTEYASDAINNIASLINKAPDKISATIKTPYGEQKINKDLNQAIKDLETNLKSSSSINDPSVKNILDLTNANNFGKIEAAIKEAMDKYKKEISSSAGIDLLNKKIVPLTSKVNKWHSKLFNLLSNADNLKNKKPDASDEDKKKSDEVKQNLLKAKNSLEIMKKWFDNINKLVKEAQTVPVEPQASKDNNVIDPEYDAEFKNRLLNNNVVFEEQPNNSDQTSAPSVNIDIQNNQNILPNGPTVEELPIGDISPVENIVPIVEEVE